MLGTERIYEIFSRIQKFSSADEVEAIIAGGRSALTRFANNTIHQNVAEEGYVVSIRVALDHKTARATTNRLDDESLKRAVQSAEQIARVQEPDPDLLPVPTPEEAKDGPAVQRHFGATAAIKPEDRAEAVEQIVAVARRHRQTTAGIYSSSEHLEALLNSRGLAKIHRQTSSEVSITMLADDSSGWQKANSPNVANLDPKRLAEIAAEKAAKSAQPREVLPGKYTVVLEPAAVLDLLGFMFFDFGGTALLEQRSFLNNRVGTRLFGENISIHDDAYHPLQSGATFDGEGVPRQALPLIEKGVVKNLVYSRATAQRMQQSEVALQLGPVRPTGHGFPLPNEIGDAPMNIVVEGGDENSRTVDQMVSSIDRGILVTRLWYIREVDPYEKILTGMTRDGTFLIEGGKRAGGVRNFRFNQSLIDMLQNVAMLGRSVRASGEESFDMVVPAMTVNNFNFTELTKF
ncbi:MAG TPA: TldD/PmbA family protein [Terriglobales bacterium]|nr:TldD/PmbA family protein [Terriglobales bacterium]